MDTEKDIQKDDDDGWTIVTKGFKPKIKHPVTVYTSNAFNLLTVNDDPKKIHHNCKPMHYQCQTNDHRKKITSNAAKQLYKSIDGIPSNN